MIDLDAFQKHLEEVAKTGGRLPECLVPYETYKKIMAGEIPCPQCGSKHPVEESNETS